MTSVRLSCCFLALAWFHIRVITAHEFCCVKRFATWVAVCFVNIVMALSTYVPSGVVTEFAAECATDVTTNLSKHVAYFPD